MPADCVVCLEQCTDTAKLPCCHVDGASMQLCHTCAEQLFATPGPCPKCRVQLAWSSGVLERAGSAAHLIPALQTLIGDLPQWMHAMIDRVIPGVYAGDEWDNDRVREVVKEELARRDGRVTAHDRELVTTASRRIAVVSEAEVDAFRQLVNGGPSGPTGPLM